MKIGVPKEIKPQENRIGLTPDSVKTLVSEGIDANYQDMINYSVFALIHLGKHKND